MFRTAFGTVFILIIHIHNDRGHYYCFAEIVFCSTSLSLSLSLALSLSLSLSAPRGFANALKYAKIVRKHTNTHIWGRTVAKKADSTIARFATLRKLIRQHMLGMLFLCNIHTHTCTRTLQSVAAVYGHDSRLVEWLENNAQPKNTIDHSIKGKTWHGSYPVCSCSCCCWWWNAVNGCKNWPLRVEGFGPWVQRNTVLEWGNVRKQSTTNCTMFGIIVQGHIESVK